MPSWSIWLSAAAGPLAFGPAHARAGHVFKRAVEPRAYELANKLLTVMESALAQHQYLVDAAQPTIADVAMYSYTDHAPEGGILLTPYVNVRRWMPTSRRGLALCRCLLRRALTRSVEVELARHGLTGLGHPCRVARRKLLCTMAL
jgi:glutathione S-transferase